jgi:DNA-binding NtrC family response regulator
MSDHLLRLLVVDDDDLIIQSIRMALPQQWKMTGVNRLEDVPKERFHAAFVDMHLTGNTNKAEGLEVVESLSNRDSHLEIVAMSGNLDNTLMEDCLKKGASRFLAKPMSAEEIRLVLDKIEGLYLLQRASTRTAGEAQWIGKGAASESIRKQIAQLRGEAGPILIEGESGTGKEVAARLIHSQASEGPLIQVNVAAIPENLFESEIFGHVRGAFTGADINKMGLAEAANGGDLFLDEIEALPLSMQAKLLRFLEVGEVRRVGSKDTIKVRVRVIAATNQNLEEMVKHGRFREDLLWRLAGKKILLPPLRERPDDVQVLSEHFLQLDRPRRNKTLAPEAIEHLKTYRWPGNVRELKRVLEQVSLTSPLPIIRKTDLAGVIQTSVSSASAGGTIDVRKGLHTLMADFEKRVIEEAIKTSDDMDEVSRILDISRSSLYKKLKDYNIQTEG